MPAYCSGYLGRIFLFRYDDGFACVYVQYMSDWLYINGIGQHSLSADLVSFTELYDRFQRRLWYVAKFL